MKISSSFQRHGLVYLAVLVMLFIGLNTAIVYYNNTILKATNAEKQVCERANLLVEYMWDEVVRNVDIGTRGYALAKRDVLLQPMKDAIAKKPLFVKELRDILDSQGFQGNLALDSINNAVDDFIAVSHKMVQMVRDDDMEGFVNMLNSDPGRTAWFIVSRNSNTIRTFEDNLKNQASASYENANFRIVIFQTVLCLTALPTLMFMIVKIRRDSKARENLFHKLEKNNRDFLFDPGTPMEIQNGDAVIENSIRNFKTATTFIRQVSSGNFAVSWDGLTLYNEARNKDNLAGELIQMRDKMKQIKKEDDIRNWVSEGLAKFSEILRKDQNDIQTLSYNSLVFITKYMQAQQGALFVLKEDEEHHQYLDMTACYAFNRKKYLTKRVEIGQGLIGQVYLEGRPVIMTEIPNGYTMITSGLGESTPNCILIVPFRANDKIEAVVELAGFKKFEKHEMEFMEKVGEIVASTLSSVRNTEMMRTVLQQFKSQTEQLKAQEEELRQNMEEMEATQEAMRRQEKHQQMY
jgi:CHASE3 domain sensor protein